MGLNLSTNPTFTGRITAPSLDYPQGSSQNETSAGANDGTPYNKQRADDIFGLQQALMNAVQTAPTGNADTALASDYLQAINALASGRANTYDETGAANAYVLGLRAGQQKVHALFDGFTALFIPANVNTGAATVDVSAALGQAPGTTVKNVTRFGGSALIAGDVNERVALVFNLVSDRFELDSRLGATALSFTGNGYQIFESGLIIQWGSTPSGSTSSDVTGSFPIPFPTGALGFFITADYVLGSGTVATHAGRAVSTSQYTFRSSVNLGAKFIAIGY